MNGFSKNKRILAWRHGNRVDSSGQALEIERNYFKSLLINTTTGILVVSAERVIQEVNPRLCELFGYESDELLGRSAEILHINREYYETFNVWFRQALLEESPLVQIEYQYRRKDGSLFWAVISGMKSQLQNRTNGVIWSLIEITDRKLAEQALQESEQKFRTVADHMYDWEYWKAPNGSLIYSSPSCERITGYTAEEFLHDPELLTRIIHPDDLDKFMHHLDYEANNMAPAECQTSDFRIRTRNGEERWIAHVCQQAFDQEGRSLGRRACNRDVTKPKQTEEALLKLNSQLANANEEMGLINRELEQRRCEAEEARNKLQQLSSAVVNSPAMVVITDHLGRIAYTNPKFTEITGYLPEEVAGRNPSMLNAGVQPKELYRELWKTILAGKDWRGDFCNRKKNGELYWEHASISPITDEFGTITHFVAIKEDVTEQRRIAEELQSARDSAEAATRSKSEFLANMSHEIRTPLNAIIGFSTLALKSGLLPHQQDYIGRIHTSGELMLNLINDILDFSKIEAGKLKMEQIPFRLDTIVDNVLSILQQKAQDKGLTIHLIQTLPKFATHLAGDPHRLVQILVNLLSNAVKFTEQGEVTLEIALLIQEDERLQLKFSVRDTGIGISADQLTRLFQPFTQADGSTTRRFGGTGLGLSISKQLVELMGGEIWCESRPAEGSAFSFTAWFGIARAGSFEQDISGTVQRAANKEQSFNFSGSLILLVEDNEMNQHLVLEFLKNTGATIHLATNGKQAVEMITNVGKLYDLVLMDIQMPVMDGYEATRLIRSDSRFAALPIIALTANAMPDEQEQIIMVGMNAHVAKPITALTMLNTMALFLNTQEPSRKSPEPFEDKSDNEPAIPAIDGLDITEALSRLGGDKKLFLWLLYSFIESKSDAAVVIEKALNAGDTSLAERHTHTVKGLAGNMGALKLAEYALTLENNIARNDSFADIKAALDLFAEEMKRLVTDVKNQLPPVGQTMFNDNG